MRSMLVLLASLLASVYAADSQAVALKREKATDESVCDLGPSTTAGLGRRSNVLIPARASSTDQTSALFRLAGRFVAEQCRNGQLLILHGESASQIDNTTLSQLANTSCVAAAVERRETGYNSGFGSTPGFELRCIIMKHAELNATLAELERTDPFEQLLVRMGRQAGILKSPASPAPSAAPVSRPSESGTKCNEMSMSTVLGKGTCAN